MTRLVRWWVMGWMVLFGAAVQAADERYYEQRGFSQAELDQMLAPIALYPDALLSQILMAATYPRDVFEAASWSRVNPNVRGEAAVRAVEQEPWDPSVISLAAFPQILDMMDQRRDWTERLGHAFLVQPEQVMETVQDLRARADAAGNLRSSEEIVVMRQGTDYVIEAPNPEVVYVPYYDPRYVYGSWWWPEYEPVYWNPWPGYRYYGHGGFGFGYGTVIGSSFFFGAFDWPRRYVRYSNYRPWYWHGRDWRRGDRWRHDGRWRDRDGRWRDRDGRWRDGDGRWRDRDRDRRVDTGRSFTPAGSERIQPLPQAQPAPAPRAAPAGPDTGRRFAPQAQQLQPLPQSGPFPTQPRSAPIAQPDTGRVFTPRGQQLQPYQAPQARSVPMQPRVAAPQHNTQRVMPAPQHNTQRVMPAPQANTQRVMPAQPVQRSSNPAARAPERIAPVPAARSAPAPRAAPAPRSAPSEDRGSRGGGHGMQR